MSSTSVNVMNDYNFHRKLWERLVPLYGEREAIAITYYVLEVRFGLTKTDVLCGKISSLTDNDRSELEKIFFRLAKSEPVQYVLGSADFCGRQFKVRPGVLIPRPETAELCGIIKSECSGIEHPKILDIGTGSGCIAITLALDITGSDVHAWDISPEALDVAKENAAQLGANISFKQCDILSVSPSSERWNVIVSNPPYICNKEKTEMNRNVIDHEPHSALFVPDDDPLLFYRAIARYASITLNPDGLLFFEINPLYADETADVLQQNGVKNVMIKDDVFGKKRFIISHNDS